MALDLPTLKTERLTLKNISLENTADIVAWRSAPEIYCFFRSPHPLKVEEHILWFNNKYLCDVNQCSWMAYNEKKEPVGVFGLRREEGTSNIAEISYILAPSKKGKGYAKEALITIIDYATQFWKVVKVFATIHIDNLESINFAKRLGMKLADMCDSFCIFEMYTTGSIKKKIYIRCDGNQIVGIGHVMRCLAVADHVRILDDEPIFLVADDEVKELITERGYKAICLNTKWDNLEAEINILEKLLASRNQVSVLVDSYYVTAVYLKKLNSFTNVTYIDDLCLTKYDVSNLINYNLYAFDMDYEKLYKDKGDTLYLGPKYVPLRAEFGGKQTRIFEGLNKILITTGGTDNYNVLDYYLEYFISRNIAVEILAIIGKFNKNRKELYKKYKKYKNIKMLWNVNNIYDYMLDCDLCITAGGITLYELCACGTPSLMYVLADNQIDAAKKFNDTQLIPCLGDVRTDINRFSASMDEWLLKYSDKEYWESVNKRMLTIVDARGAMRIATLLHGWVIKF